jgi:hypothetical protein
VEGVLEEFYPEPRNTSDDKPESAKTAPASTGLADKLAGKVLATSGVVGGTARGTP